MPTAKQKTPENDSEAMPGPLGVLHGASPAARCMHGHGCSIPLLPKEGRGSAPEGSDKTQTVFFGRCLAGSGTAELQLSSALRPGEMDGP